MHVVYDEEETIEMSVDGDPRDEGTRDFSDYGSCSDDEGLQWRWELSGEWRRGWQLQVNELRFQILGR